MPIQFEKSRWDRIRKDYRAWWAGKLKRPLIQMRMGKARDPGRPEPKLPYLPFTSHYDLKVSAEAIVDRWDYEVSKVEYLGDSFPAIWPNFGPGVAAAFLGCELHNTERTTWFHVTEERPVADVHLRFDPENVWFKRVCDICRAAMDRWQGQVQVGLTDIGGNLDIVSSFRPSERLLLDLYDDPENVKRVTWEAHEMWWRYYEAIHGILRPVNPGYTAWTPIFSSEPYYIMQCDFAYMIGPDMFREFVRPEIAKTAAKLTNSFYHLDGKGQLPHLDHLLDIKELKGIQWVPGGGAAEIDEWPDVFRRIRQAGKLIQFNDTMERFDRVVEQLGSPEGMILMTTVEPQDRQRAEAFLKKYGAA
jgi:5-methyltetrahydrofolate--homocysteine methyltransferase